MNLVPYLIQRSLQRVDAQYLLSQLTGLASDAAAIAMNAEKAPIDAVQLLELGHSAFAGSLSEMYIDVGDLLQKHPGLGEEYVNLRGRVDPTATSTRAPVGRRPPRQAFSTAITRANDRHEAGRGFDELVAEIRRQPSFQDFLLPPTESMVLRAAEHGCIVVINVSQYRCDAIVVNAYRIRSMSLPRLKKSEIEERARRDDLGSLDTLEWLWHTITNPILNHLGYTSLPSTDSWPHVWWVPTGLLNKFPLHAAGLYHNRLSQDSPETVLDRVMSSYGSSIKEMISSRRCHAPEYLGHGRALLVAMETTAGRGNLPSATREVAEIRDLCVSMSLDYAEPPRREAVMSELLESCTIFHFAGHGHTDPLDAINSYLSLEDLDNKHAWEEEKLKVEDLLKLNLRESQPFLAYLSACETARVDDDRSADESIHLVSACQLVGFRHVIGTLWNVNDAISVDMARITYEGIRDGGMTDESVCRGLHNATRQLRDRWFTGIAMPRRAGIAGKSEEPHGDLERGAQDAPDNTRDAILHQGDGRAALTKKPLHWVPYVHYGV